METTNIFETKEKSHREGIKESFPVTGMTCASCAASVESVLKHTELKFLNSIMRKFSKQIEALSSS